MAEIPKQKKVNPDFTAPPVNWKVEHGLQMAKPF